MTQQPINCLVFKAAEGVIPCDAGSVTIELGGANVPHLSQEFLQNAAVGVLHYFKVELGRKTVSVGEFAQALVIALRGFGFDLEADVQPAGGDTAAEADLGRLASESGKSFELAFFPRLREELEARLRRSSPLIKFVGLRSCVKQLAGAQRWCPRCQTLNDQIVDYVRSCLREARHPRDCSLVVE